MSAGGNQTTYNGKTFVYDAENRIKQNTASSNNYTYDGKGSRAKAAYPWGTRFFVYDESRNLIAEASQIPNGTPMYVDIEYINGPSGTVATAIDAMSNGPAKTAAQNALNSGRIRGVIFRWPK
jgi:hypothetical protein